MNAKLPQPAGLVEICVLLSRRTIEQGANIDVDKFKDRDAA
jgi:hypothetical protein